MSFDTTVDGGAPAPLATQQNGPSSIAIGTSSVYWTNSGGAGGTVNRVSRAGGPVQLLATGQMLPQGIAVDPSGLYWTTGDGQIMAIQPEP